MSHLLNIRSVSLDRYCLLPLLFEMFAYTTYKAEDLWGNKCLFWDYNLLFVQTISLKSISSLDVLGGVNTLIACFHNYINLN